MGAVTKLMLLVAVLQPVGEVHHRYKRGFPDFQQTLMANFVPFQGYWHHSLGMHGLQTMDACILYAGPDKI